MFAGEKWFTHRKLITPTFHFNILESFVDVFVERTRDFMEKLEEIDKSDFIEISPYTQKLTLDFICGKFYFQFQFLSLSR